MNKILEYLFPDSRDGSEFAYGARLGQAGDDEEGSSEDSLLARFGGQLARVKSAPRDGLVWRLAVVMSHCLYVMGERDKTALLLRFFCYSKL